MRSSLLLALVSGTVLAQTAAVGGSDPSRGTTLLPGSSAWSDEATSLVYNPAGLGRVGRLNAWYVHERSNVRPQDNDGLWFATSIGDLIGLGVSFQWLRPSSGLGLDRAKTSLGFSAGPQAFSAGATVNWFSSGTVQWVTTVDVGVQSRPVRWLSFAAFVRNLNAPQANLVGLNTFFPREWTLGLGVRPFGERLTLGVDWLARETVPVNTSRLQYTVQAHFLGGVRVLAGFSHAFAPGESLYFHAGLGFDLENVGYTQGVAYANGQVNWQFAGRFSLDKYESVVPQQKIAVISLADLGTTSGTSLGSLLGLASEDRYLRFIRFLERAVVDPELKGLVLKVEGAGVGLARADEVRAAIAKLRAAGKKVFAYILSAGDAEYLMVSGCDGIYAAPEAMVLIDGLRSSVTFFGGTAKRFGIDVDVARVGNYKTFPEQFTRADMSDAQRETINAYLDTNVKTVAARIKAARNIEPEAWQAAIDEGLKPAKRAVELRQLDAVMTPQQFDELIGQQLPGARVARDYRPFDTRSERWGKQRSIAVIPVLGNISGGKNQTTPLTGDLVAGAQSFIEAIGEAAADSSVAAIVVRVDSGGGDGLASDLMYRAVLEAKKKKPVIASMGDVAASGGYYVAMGADEIVASPTTLTGSIGVFFAKPAIKKLAEDFGATQISISRGKLAGITDNFDPWTPDQRVAAQKWIDDFYDSFITEVASSRKLSKEAVDAVARGRVWSGEDAKAKGLVDHLGGLMDAIARAKEKSGEQGDLAISIYQASPGLIPTLLGAATPNVLLEQSLPSQKLPPGLQSLAEQLGSASWLLESPRVQARLEYTVETR
ncbi:MAG: signal peptide peptidase SppA [Archangium sp.]|nr:signal peptide peptidase SppA [Archangium sp.]